MFQEKRIIQNLNNFFFEIFSFALQTECKSINDMLHFVSKHYLDEFD